MTSDYEGFMSMCHSHLMNQVRTFNEDQLKLLLQSDEHLDAMIKHMPQFVSLKSDKETRMILSRGLADSNLSMEPKFNELKSSLNETLAEVKMLVKEVDGMRSEIGDDGGSASPDTVHALLQSSTQEAEDESESMSEKLQDGDMDVDEFVKQYEKVRVKSHLRKIKADKLGEVLTRTQAAPSLPSHLRMPRPLSQPVLPHPATGYRTSGPYVYPNMAHAYRHSGYILK